MTKNRIFKWSNYTRVEYILVFLFILLVGISGCGDRATRTYKKGLRLARQKKYDQAVVEMRRLLQMEPDNAKAHNALGQIYRAQNLYTKAIEELTLSVEMNNTDPELPYNLGCLYRDLENLPRATEFYHRAVEIDPQFAPALYRLGAVYADQGAWDKAAAYFRAFLEAAPERPGPGHNNLGVLIWKNGEQEEARAEFKRALECEPDLPEALYNFGVSSLTLDEKDPAGIKALLAYLKARPRAREGLVLKRYLQRAGAVSSSGDGLFSRDDYLNRGQEYESAGQYRLAAKEYERALQLDSNSSEAHYRLGTLYDQFLGEYVDAIHHYETFLAGNRRSSRAPEVIARLKEVRSRVGSDALSGEGLLPPPPTPSPPPYSPVAASTPVLDAAGYYREGKEWEDKGDPARALSAYRRCLELSPEYGRAYLGIGTASISRGEYGDAASALIKARSLDDSLPVRKPLAGAYLRLGDGSLSSKRIDEAIEYFRKARAEGRIIQADEGLWKAHHAYFREKYQKGDYSAAAAHLRSCLEIKPDVADDYLALGDLYSRKLGNQVRARRYYIKYLEQSPEGKAADRVKKIVQPVRPEKKPAQPKKPVGMVTRPRALSATEYYNRGANYQRAGQYKAARKEYLHAINLKPDFYQAYYNLGVLYSKTRRPSQALAAYKKAASLKSDFARAQLAIFNLYWYHYKMKNQARPYARRYIQLAPETPQAKELTRWLNE